MRHSNSLVQLLFFTVTAIMPVCAQTEANSKAESDVLILTDGEKLIGHLESATGATVGFKSNLVGELIVAWSKIQELHSSEKFAAIPKGITLHGSDSAADIARGTVAVTNQQLQVEGGKSSPQVMPTANIGRLVEAGDFDKAFHRTNFLQGWKGGATAGISLTEATQKNQAFTAALNLVRTVPAEDWLDPRSRTTLDYNQAYGKLTQPGTAAVKTSLYHAGAEQDWYLSPRVFAFGQAIFDHSFSQGLQLQQTYGGGLGFVVFKTPAQEFDVKASGDYVDQRFEDSTLNKQLFGSIFGETYVRTFAHGILLNEQGGVTPAWTDTKAYSAFATAALTFPVYRRFGLTLSGLDDFLNNPPPGFKKNSFQFTAGATYSFK